MATAASRLVRMLDELGRVSDERGKLTRTFLSPAMARANARVAGWMRAAGLAVREDGLGNVIGRLDPAGHPATTAPAKTLLLGSHLDTVRDAGRFDGALGVLLPIVALGELRRKGLALPFAIEVIGFSEEEGVRFSSAYLGSKGYAGCLHPSDLKVRDASGVSVGQALLAWNQRRAGDKDRSRRGGSGSPKPGYGPPRSVRADEAAQGVARFGRSGTARNLLGYLEVHIEQGPVLEAKNLAVGVVSAIAGQTRARLAFRGQAGHAGTTPMNLRRDALAGAAEFVIAAESLGRSNPPLVATVGTIAVTPGAANVIPGNVELSVDVRHPQDRERTTALGLLYDWAKRIARARKLDVSWTLTQDNPAVACSPELTATLVESVQAVQGKTASLVSGAGHDAVIISSIAPVAMLFVRCRDGLSHHPDEYAAPKDIAVALDVVIDFIARLEGRDDSPSRPRSRVGTALRAVRD